MTARLSNEWFSIMISITCLMGVPGMPAADGFACVVVAPAAEVTAVAAASSGRSTAIRRRLYGMGITSPPSRTAANFRVGFWVAPQRDA